MKPPAAVSDGSVVDYVFQLLDHGSLGALVGLLCIVGEGLVAAILPQAGAHLRQQRMNSLSQALCMEVSLPPLETTMETFRPRLCFSAGYSMYSS